MRRMLARRAWKLGLLGMLVLGLAGCTAVVDRLEDALIPTVTPRVTSSSPGTIPAATIPPTMTPLPTYTPAPTETAAPPTSVPTSERPVATVADPADLTQGLLLFQGQELLLGDYYGASPSTLAQFTEPDSWDVADSRVAVAQAGIITIMDLGSGAQQTFEVVDSSRIDYAEVHWGSAGRGVPHLARVPDANATNFGSSVELRVVSPEGDLKGGLLVPDVPGVHLLHYDDLSGQVALVRKGADASFAEVQFMDPVTAQVVRTIAVEGEGRPVMSPDGSLLLSQQYSDNRARLALYDAQTGEVLQTRDLPAGTHSAWHVWSPDGASVAYLLFSGSGEASDPLQGLGLWLLEVDTFAPSQVLAQSGARSRLLGWTPDGVHLVGYQQGETDETYHYLVRPDGGNLRILAVSSEAQIWGWLPQAESAKPVVVDPWRGRFLQAAGDAGQTAALVAEFVGQYTGAEPVGDVVGSYLQESGWGDDLVAPSLKVVDASVSVLQLPPMDIFVLEGVSAQRIAAGNVIMDARLEGDDLGIIFGMLGTSGVQPTFMLLTRQDEVWRALWVPQGLRDWLATDGEIRFSGEGLEQLQVSGTSFGLSLGADYLFHECHACPHRELSATWHRQDSRYVRETTLPPSASLPEVIWEMTAPTPYAILTEALRLLRSGQPAQEWFRDASVIAELEDAGLLDEAAHLIPASAKGDAVEFRNSTTDASFRAIIGGEQIVSVERLQE